MPTFVKRNTLGNDSLLKEAKGLELLQKSLEASTNNYLKTPKIYSVTKQKLQLEEIKSTYSNSLMEKFAIGLAKLHEIKFDKFGLEEDNYIGLNPQKNIISDNWGEFFYKYRLFYQVDLIQNNSVKKEFKSILEKKHTKIADFLNETTSYPSLVHGDLWSGNVLFSKYEVYLIDPAIYYGDREVDIAMSELFGGFSQDFYNKYNETLPLSRDYNRKKRIYNLYHYLNHYNLFGNSYLNTCITYIDQI